MTFQIKRSIFLNNGLTSLAILIIYWFSFTDFSGIGRFKALFVELPGFFSFRLMLSKQEPLKLQWMMIWIWNDLLCNWKFIKPHRNDGRRSTFGGKIACVASVSNQVTERKLEREQKKRWKGEGEGRRGNACPQTPRFWKTPLDISRFGWFVNWQLVKIEVLPLDYQICKITLFSNRTSSRRLQNCNKKGLR